MKKLWLILDCHYLCHRAFYVFGGLSHEGASTGIAFGFLKDIEILKKQFSTNDIAFCWDLGRPLRMKEDKNYKSDRKKNKKDLTSEEAETYTDFKIQIKAIRKTYLKTIGYRNNFYQKGYEADDLIASLCINTLSQKDEAIIISADHDLYQLLNNRVSIYHPQTKKIVTKKSFIEKFDITPFDWHKVKAIAGCSSDNVKGVAGVGEKTAIKYLKGELKKESKAYQNIEAAKKNGLIDGNLKLVRLPFMGVNTYAFKKDKISKSAHRSVLRSLGIKSF